MILIKRHILWLKGRDYIAVFGGKITTFNTVTDSIELYDLSAKPNTWESIPGLILLSPLSGICGSLVKQFDENGCSAMFISIWETKVMVCNDGNYTWSTYNLGINGISCSKLALVDASFVGGTII
jgi:hypothetical protein